MSAAPIPRAALLLGLAGLIPFLWGAAGVLFEDLAAWSLRSFGARFTGALILQNYGIIILAFMSGVIWGFATRAEGLEAAKSYTLSTLPALWAFFFGTGETAPALAALAAGFGGLLLIDWMMQARGFAPGWWIKLRLLLTSIVVACLVVGAIG